MIELLYKPNKELKTIAKNVCCYYDINVIVQECDEFLSEKETRLAVSLNQIMFNGKPVNRSGFVVSEKIANIIGNKYFFNTRMEYLGENFTSHESCLSILDIKDKKVKRNDFIRMSFDDVNGVNRLIEISKELILFDGKDIPYNRKDIILEVFQHEHDHSIGKLITDY